jgi:hypothetical protein
VKYFAVIPGRRAAANPESSSSLALSHSRLDSGFALTRATE